jgi:hypothetical protein
MLKFGVAGIDADELGGVFRSRFKSAVQNILFGVYIISEGGVKGNSTGGVWGIVKSLLNSEHLRVSFG